MLNISQNSIKNIFPRESFKAFSKLEKPGKNVAVRITMLLLVIALIGMFLPWTQNIRASGDVTTLQPDQRPQTIHSIIPGRIEEWYVQEGDFVHKGDTIMFISEIKAEYLDPQLLERTEQQVKTKELTVSSYMEKVKALDNQIDALIANKKARLKQAQNKLRQAHLKVQSDSIDFEVSKVDYTIAQRQLERTEQLYDDGIKSLTEVEGKRLKLQDASGKMITAENNLLSSRNGILIAEMELSTVEADYNDKIAKSEAEKYAALSSMYDAEAVVTKLQNQYMNYSRRRGMYYVTAPQNGYVTKAIKSGIGETLKEGAEIVSIMPSEYELAVSVYVDPINLPLVEMGQKVRVQFDGWPAVIFRGWPGVTYGTFGGEIVAIDQFISPNGKYRILIKQDASESPWPDPIRVGAGARTLMLLKEVPIWYELWRQLNGFPPDYYKKQTKSEK